MKNKSILLSLLLGFIFPTAFAQNGPHKNGGAFEKKIENNYKNKSIQIIKGKKYGIWNLDSKTELEKRFFGDYNADVEFFVSPSFEGATGFRLTKDSTEASYILEVKRVSNYKEASRLAEEKFPSIGIPMALLNSLPKNIKSLIFDHNSAMYPKAREEELKLYTIETRSFPVSDRFAEKLYSKMLPSIDDFKAEGRPEGFFDGYRVTFRCVVGDELRSLHIRMPQGDILAFSDLCRQMIDDAGKGEFVESKYIKSLKK